MWVSNTCDDCGNRMAMDAEIILDAAIDIGELTIKSVTRVRDIRLREVTKLRELFEETKRIIMFEWGDGFSIQKLRSELLHKYLFSNALIDDFIDELKLDGYYESRGRLVAVT